MSKSEQTGEKDYPLHLFANSITRSIRPLLNLAIHVICKPIFSRGQTLFSTYRDDGPDEGRICSLLHKT